MDTKRYVGYDAELFFNDEPVGHGRVSPEPGNPIDRLLERCDDLTLGHKVIIISCGDHQVAELAGLMGMNERVIEPRYIVQDVTRGPRKGKGQRKANRGGRWH